MLGGLPPSLCFPGLDGRAPRVPCHASTWFGHTVCLGPAALDTASWAQPGLHVLSEVQVRSSLAPGGLGPTVHSPLGLGRLGLREALVIPWQALLAPLFPCSLALPYTMQRTQVLVTDILGHGPWPWGLWGLPRSPHQTFRPLCSLPPSVPGALGHRVLLWLFCSTGRKTVR